MCLMPLLPEPGDDILDLGLDGRAEFDRAAEPVVVRQTMTIV